LTDVGRGDCEELLDAHDENSGTAKRTKATTPRAPRCAVDFRFVAVMPQGTGTHGGMRSKQVNIR
jgi:hypothetical protein